MRFVCANFFVYLFEAKKFGQVEFHGGIDLKILMLVLNENKMSVEQIRRFLKNVFFLNKVQESFTKIVDINQKDLNETIKL